MDNKLGNENKLKTFQETQKEKERFLDTEIKRCEEEERHIWDKFIKPIVETYNLINKYLALQFYP